VRRGACGCGVVWLFVVVAVPPPGAPADFGAGVLGRGAVVGATPPCAAPSAPVALGLGATAGAVAVACGATVLAGAVAVTIDAVLATDASEALRDADPPPQPHSAATARQKAREPASRSSTRSRMSLANRS
jgi:hypothetical protein